VITRWILRRISKIDRVHEIVPEILVNLMILAALVLVPIFVGAKVARFLPMAGATVMMAFILNSIDFIAGFAALLLALLLLLHRFLWPMIQRPLYAIHRFAPVGNKKLLWAIGIGLIVLPTHSTIEFLKSLLSRL